MNYGWNLEDQFLDVWEGRDPLQEEGWETELPETADLWVDHGGEG